MKKEENNDLFGIKDAVKPAHVSSSTGNNEWYTPDVYIDSARAVLGCIDLDPASSASANGTIKAERYFSSEDSGLLHDWFGTVWMNPPFAQPLVRQFSEKLVHHYECGDVTQACVLVNNGTETRHGQMLLNACSGVCFTAKRIRFIAPDGVTKNAPLQGQMILYFGKNSELFESVFSSLGSTMQAKSHV